MIILEENYYLEDKNGKYFENYIVKDMLGVIKKGTGYSIQNYGIKLKELEKEKLSFKLIHNDKKICGMNFELDVIEDFERQNNEFILAMDKRNKIEKILNKKEMIQNIDDKIFDFLEKNPEYSERIIDIAYKHKKLLSTEKTLETFMNTEGMSSFLFIDIFGKNFHYDKETVVTNHIGNIVPNVAIPIDFKFKIKGKNQEELILGFESEYNSDASETNIILALKEYFEYPMYEKYDFKLDIKGEYIIDIRENKLKEYDVTRKLNLAGNKYIRQIIVKKI